MILLCTYFTTLIYIHHCHLWDIGILSFQISKMIRNHTYLIKYIDKTLEVRVVFRGNARIVLELFLCLLQYCTVLVNQTYSPVVHWLTGQACVLHVSPIMEPFVKRCPPVLLSHLQIRRQYDVKVVVVYSIFILRIYM